MTKQKDNRGGSDDSNDDIDDFEEYVVQSWGKTKED